MGKIKIGLLGLGRTGRIVADSFHNDNRFNIVFAVKKNLPKTFEYDFSVETKKVLPDLIEKFKPRVIIDFTSRKGTLENIKHLKKNMGIIIATTGFTSEDIKALKRHRHLKILYAPNISDGINILMKACKLINKLWGNADVEVIEEHFKGKKDISATARKIADVFNKDVKIHSVRAGGIIGVHRVIFARPNQKIIIEHESFSRGVFAEASKKAVIWLHKKKRGFYEISEMYK